MKVYILQDLALGVHTFAGIFSTREKAEAARDRRINHYANHPEWEVDFDLEIMEWELDE